MWITTVLELRHPCGGFARFNKALQVEQVVPYGTAKADEWYERKPVRVCTFAPLFSKSLNGKAEKVGGFVFGKKFRLERTLPKGWLRRGVHKTSCGCC